MAYPLSLEAAEQLKDMHVMSSKVTLFNAGGDVAFNWEENQSQVISGEVIVTMDNNGTVSRTCRVSLIDPDRVLVPATYADAAWYGRKLTCARGVLLPSTGTYEYVPLGVFRISNVKVVSTQQNLVVSLTGKDYSYQVDRARFTDVYTIAAGTNIGAAIRTLLEQAGITTFAFEAVTDTLPVARTFARAGSRWQEAQTLARGIGYLLYFDGGGVAVLRSARNPAEMAPNWRYDNLRTDSYKFVDISREMTDDRIYNHVIVSGESSTMVVRGEASDTDPNSPTRVSGPFGDVPYFMTTAATTTTAQANALAFQRLQSVRLGEEVVNMTIVPNPAIEAYDIVQVREPRAKVDGYYQVGGFIVPLGRGVAMTLSPKRVR